MIGNTYRLSRTVQNPVLQQLVAELLSVDQPLERGADLLVQAGDPLAQLVELRVGHPRQLSGGVERLLQREHHERVERDPRRDPGEGGRGLGRLVERLHQVEQRPERVARARELDPVEHHALPGAHRRLAHVGDRPDRQPRPEGLEREHLGAPVERELARLAVRERA
ncbi:MAG: hypothetical protein ABMA64_09895, partial [Myxococcota bacterium]